MLPVLLVFPSITSMSFFFNGASIGILNVFNQLGNFLSFYSYIGGFYRFILFFYISFFSFNLSIFSLLFLIDSSFAQVFLSGSVLGPIKHGWPDHPTINFPLVFSTLEVTQDSRGVTSTILSNIMCINIVL